MSILLTAEKRSCLPSGVVQKLVQLLRISYIGDFAVLIISRLEKLDTRDPEDLQLLSDKLLSEKVVVEQENAMPTIEELNSANNGNCSVALLAAQLMLKCVENSQEFPEVSEKTLQNLLTAADSCRDENVKPLAIKVVYLVSRMENQPSSSFSRDILLSLKGFVNNEVFLISTYAHASYVRRLAIRASLQEEPLTSDFVETPSSLYVVRDSMRIGEKDFVREINTNVLEMMARETRKGHKIEDEDFFLMMEQVIYENRSREFSLKVSINFHFSVLFQQHAFSLCKILFSSFFCPFFNNTYYHCVKY